MICMFWLGRWRRTTDSDGHCQPTVPCGGERFDRPETDNKLSLPVLSRAAEENLCTYNCQEAEQNCVNAPCKRICREREGRKYG